MAGRVTGWTAQGLHWGGVSFRTFYESVIAPEAGPEPGVSHVLFQGADGYRATLALDDAFDDDVLLADQLGGTALDSDHGAPVRLLSPKQYGYKSTKHLSCIELHTREPADGHRIEMLRALRQKGAHPVVLAHAPGLPFPEDRFDAVLASFVLSHFKDYGQTLADMVRVLRPKGHVAVTAWGAAPNPVGQAWKDVTAGFVDTEELQAAFRELIPWDEWFSRATNLRHALEEAELVGVDVTRREYLVTMSVTDYLSVKEASVEGTLLCQRLTAEQRKVFRQRLADVFRSQFGETVEYVRDVYFGMGTKPAA